MALGGSGEVTVRIPSPLRNLTGGQGQVKAQAADLRGLINALEADFPGFRARLCEGDGSLRQFVNVFINDEDVRLLGGLDSPVPAGARVSILPAVAGGSR